MNIHSVKKPDAKIQNIFLLNKLHSLTIECTYCWQVAFCQSRFSTAGSVENIWQIQMKICFKSLHRRGRYAAENENGFDESCWKLNLQMLIASPDHACYASCQVNQSFIRGKSNGGGRQERNTVLDRCSTVLWCYKQSWAGLRGVVARSK